MNCDPMETFNAMPLLVAYADWYRPDAAADVLRALAGLDEESLACTILIAAYDAEEELNVN